MKKVILLAALACAFSFSAKADQSCREGQEEIFSSSHGDGEGDVREIYVCKNGVFVKKFGAEDRYVPQYRACKEGSFERWEEMQGGETAVSVLYVCKGGRFVPVYNNNPVRNERPHACREGARESFTTGGGEGEPSVTEHYVCHRGQWTRTN